ncbi:MAG: AMP-binding protein [Myxococcota bacterium]
MKTLMDVLRAAAPSPHGVRFVAGDETTRFYRYREILERSLRMAGWYREQGVQAGDTVALVLPTGIGFFDAFFGAIAIGAVPVPMYPPIRLGRLDEYHDRSARMLAGCAASLLVTERRIHRVLGRTIERYSPPRGVAVLEQIGLDAYSALDHSALDASSRDSDALAFVQFSSGTTALPKPIALTHEQVVANVDAIMDQILTAYPEDDTFQHRGCSWLPLYHDMGLVGCVFVSMNRPRDLVLIPPEQFVARPVLWLRALSTWGGTISPAPNFAYSLCVDRIRDQELEGVDLSKWCVAMNGAEPVTPRVLEAFVERFGAFGLRPESLTPVYGLGEASLAVTFSSLPKSWSWSSFDRDALAEQARARVVERGGVDLVSLGPPLPGFDIDIRDGEHSLDEGTLGDVWIRGPSLMRGYLGLDELNEEVFDGDWLDTGDRGFLYEGELYLFGRRKDTIVVRGRNYAAQDIEHALDGMEGIRPGGLAAIGRLEDGGEQLWILAETGLSGPDERAELVERIQSAVFERCSLACRVELLERGTLPRTSSGKVGRARARELIEAGQLRAPKPVNAPRMLAEVFRSMRGHRRSLRGRR